MGRWKSAITAHEQVLPTRCWRSSLARLGLLYRESGQSLGDAGRPHKTGGSRLHEPRHRHARPRPFYRLSLARVDGLRVLLEETR